MNKNYELHHLFKEVIILAIQFWFEFWFEGIIYFTTYTLQANMPIFKHETKKYLMHY